MTSTNVVQFSVQLPDGRIFVVGGETPTQFETHYTQLFGADAMDALITECVHALHGHAVQMTTPPPQGPPDFVPEQYHGQMQAPQQWQQQAPAAPGGPPGPQPQCQCNAPMKWVPGGYSQAKQRSYAGFWACPRPRGQQCPPPRQS